MTLRFWKHKLLIMINWHNFLHKSVEIKSSIYPLFHYTLYSLYSSVLFAKSPYESHIKIDILERLKWIAQHHEQLTVTDLSVDVSSSLSQPRQAVSVSSNRCAVCWGVLEVTGCGVHLTPHLHQTHKALQLHPWKHRISYTIMSTVIAGRSDGKKMKTCVTS